MTSAMSRKGTPSSATRNPRNAQGLAIRHALVILLRIGVLTTHRWRNRRTSSRMAILTSWRNPRNAKEIGFAMHRLESSHSQAARDPDGAAPGMEPGRTGRARRAAAACP
jgi:hypothetical protein